MPAIDAPKIGAPIAVHDSQQLSKILASAQKEDCSVTYLGNSQVELLHSNQHIDGLSKSDRDFGVLSFIHALRTQEKEQSDHLESAEKFSARSILQVENPKILNKPIPKPRTPIAGDQGAAFRRTEALKKTAPLRHIHHERHQRHGAHDTRIFEG